MKSTFVMYGFDDGKKVPVGFIMAIPGTKFYDPTLLTSLYVQPKFRGQGHGRALLKAYLTQADREKKVVLLSVDPGEPGIEFERLVRLYEGYGFKLLADGTTMRRQWNNLPKPTVSPEMSVPQDQLRF